MDLQYFKSKLTKRQIEELATMDAEKILMSGEENPLDVQIYFKKVKAYTDKFLQKNEPAAMEEYHKFSQKVVVKDDIEIQHIQGGNIPDYEQDLIYAEIKEKLNERRKLLDLVFKTNQEVYDDQGVKVPKVKVKTIKKDSLAVRL